MTNSRIIESLRASSNLDDMQLCGRWDWLQELSAKGTSLSFAEQQTVINMREVVNRDLEAIKAGKAN